jgi:hypothetical protein
MAEIKMYAQPGAFCIKEEEMVTEYQSLMANAPLFGDTEEYKQAFRDFCSKVRSMLEINNVISFEIAEEMGLMVLVYDTFPMPGKMFKKGYDEKGPYMVLMEG